MKFFKTSLFFLSSFVFFQSLMADSLYHRGDYYFSPGVAYYHFSEKRDLQNAAMANLTAGFFVSDQFSLEAFYGQASTEFSETASAENARFYDYSLGGVYHFETHSNLIFHPYFSTGFDVMNQNDNQANVGNETLMGVHAGLGAHYFVNPHIAFFTELRNIYTLSGGKNDVMLNGGIQFLFDANVTEEASLPPAVTDGPSGFYQLQESVDL